MNCRIIINENSEYLRGFFMKKDKTKRLLSILVTLILFTFSIHAKEPLSYQKIVELDGFSKHELYAAVCQTLAKMYYSSKSAIQYQDAETGTIISNCHEKIKFNFVVAPTDFKMTINVKDGKIRITFSEISFTVTVGKTSSTNYITNEKALNDFKKEGDKIIATLIDGIKNKSVSDDW